MMYVSRVLSPAGVGKVSFATSVVGYFALFVQMGIPLYGMRKIAEVKDNKVELSKNLKEILSICFSLWLIVYIIFILAISFVPKFHNEWQLYMIMGVNLLYQAIGCEWFYKAIGKYKYIMTRSITVKFIALILTFLLVRHTEDYKLYGGVLIIAGAANNLCNFFSLRKYADLKKNPDIRLQPMSHFKYIFTFFFMCCTSTIYGNLDTVMIGFMKGDSAVGYYHIATRICYVLTSITGVIWNVTLPRATELWKNGETESFDAFSKKSMSMVSYIQIPLTVLFIMTANSLVYVLAGSGYDSSVVASRILFLSVIPIGFSNIIGGQMLIPMKLEKKLLYAEMSGAIANLLTNLFAIYYIGIIGAAITTVIAETLVWLIAWYNVNKYHNIKLYNLKAIIKNIIATLLAAASIIWIYFIKMPHIVMLIISFSLFLVIYYCLTYLFKDNNAKLIYSSTLGRIKNDKR